MNETGVINGIDMMGQPEINEISLEEPWQWLVRGWQDVKAAPQFSLAYGLVFVIVSYLLVWGLMDGGMFFIIPLLAAGFFLSAPILGLGLYGISRSLELKEKVEFCQIQKAWRSNPVNISAVGIILMLIMLFWMLSSILIFTLFFNQPTMQWDQFLISVFLSGENTLFLVVGIGSGGLLALFTFCISVITVPMLMDRQVDFMTAIKTSVATVKKNPRPMMLWAYLITMMVCISFMTYFIGLLVIMPVVGHATWHAYRDLVA